MDPVSISREQKPRRRKKEKKNETFRVNKYRRRVSVRSRKGLVLHQSMHSARENEFIATSKYVEMSNRG